MTNELMTRASTEVGLAGTDPFAQYGARAQQQGLYLSFKNGDWSYGQNGDELPIGTRLIANMPGLRIGWKRWQDRQVTSEVMQLLIENPREAPRSTLGDDDPSLWPIDDRTKQVRDPWALTNELQLVDGTGQQYIYSTSSQGGLNCIRRLCEEYSKLRRQKPNMLPVVELEADHYQHKEFGKTYVPQLPICAWLPEGSEVADIDAPPEPKLADLPFDADEPVSDPEPAAPTAPPKSPPRTRTPTRF